MPARQLEWTAEEAMALPADGNRYEVLDGALFVTPAPALRHQRALEDLGRCVATYVRRHRVGWLLRAPADIVFSPRRLVQPDLFVVPWLDERPEEWVDVKSLLLAIEVLSPSTAHADRHRKRIIYQSQRVPEYWIVDLDSRQVERWRPDDSRPEILVESLEWRPRPERKALVLDLIAFFDDVLGRLPDERP